LNGTTTDTMKTTLRTVRILWAVCCGLLAALFLSDIVCFLRDPSPYPIGAPIGWSYASNGNYVTTSSILGGWFLIGVALCVWPQKRWRYIPLSAHIVLSVTWFVWMRLTLP